MCVRVTMAAVQRGSAITSAGAPRTPIAPSTHSSNTAGDAVVAQLRRGRSVLVIGPGGIGKSTALDSAVLALHAADADVMVAAASETARHLAFGAFAGIVELRDGQSAAERIATGARWLARARGTVLVIDDAHLLDGESAAFLHHVVANGAAAVCASVRSGEPCPDAVERAMRAPGVERVEVIELSQIESANLVESMLGGTVDERTLASMVAAGEGNPLQLRQVVHDVQRSGTLHRRHGVWTAPGAGVVAGETLRERLARRVAGWDAPSLRLAKLLAVGGRMPERVAARFAPPGVLDAAVAERWVVRRDDQVELLHALLVDSVLAATAPDERRSTLGELIAAAALVGAGAPDLVLPYVSWLSQFGDRDEDGAHEALVTAAVRLVKSAKTALALPLIERAVGLRPTPEANRVLAQCRATLGIDGDVLDEHELMNSARGRMLGFVSGERPEPVDDLVARTRSRLRDPSNHFELDSLELGFALLLGAPVEPATTMLVELLRRDRSHSVTAYSVQVAAQTLCQAGRPETALAIGAETDLPEHLQNHYHQVMTTFVRAMAHVSCGDVGRAVSLYAERVVQRWGSDFLAGVLQSTLLGQIDLLGGRPVQAARAYSKVVEELGPIDPAGEQSLARAQLRLALAWRNRSLEGSPSIGPVAGASEIRRRQIELTECQTLAAVGDLAAAAALAERLAAEATEEGRYAIAVNAWHLVARAADADGAPRPDVTGAVAELVAVCEGPVLPLIARHVEVLARPRGDALTEIALGFDRLGRGALAAESAWRAVALRGAPDESRALAVRLRERGVTALLDAFVRDTEPQPIALSVLTAREADVARLAAAGETTSAIAAALSISARTAETHLHNAYRKLDVHDRTALAQLLNADG